ncbi:hypothetical protein [Sphingobacterium mizutaii]|uniref:hypothetical protein n=1 Tax=Sphingobacterium mizutaii TaxID=1010 RepID=UPI0016295C0C|nr:hypothetical protein [Sphingobacterium mizutaii]
MNFLKESRIFNRWNEYEKLLNLLKEKNDGLFDYLLSCYSNNEESKIKSYDDRIKNVSYNEGHGNIPDKLYKFINYNSGIKSLENQNLQFSHPLSFHDLGNDLTDLTEFNLINRFYIDHKSIEQIKRVLISQGKGKILKNNSEYFTFLIYNFVMSCLERNKVCCLSENKDNDYLWKGIGTGFCIEYDTLLFQSNNNFHFENGKKSTLLYNRVQYVEEIIKYPVRIDEYDWLSNLIFIKQSIPYKNEEEFRILLTQEITIFDQRLNREERFKAASGRIFNLPSGYEHNSFLRPTFNKKYISKVYYSDKCKDIDGLKKLLNDLEIKVEKI